MEIGMTATMKKAAKNLREIFSRNRNIASLDIDLVSGNHSCDPKRSCIFNVRAAEGSGCSRHYKNGCADLDHAEQFVYGAILHCYAAQGPVPLAAASMDEYLSAQGRVGGR